MVSQFTSPELHRKFMTPLFFSRTILFFIAALSLISISFTASSQSTSTPPQPLDSIAAIVDNDVILTSELQHRTQLIEAQLKQQNHPAPPTETLRKQVLERLILESIQTQLAAHAGIRVSDNDVNETIQHIAEQNHVSVEQFQKKLALEHLPYADFRQQIYLERLISQVQQRYVSSRIQITDQDVQHFLQSPIAQQSIGTEYHVHHILVPISDTPSHEEIQQAEQLAQNIDQQLRDKKTTFESLALTYSAGHTALEGGDLGWRKAGQLPSVFADTVLHMKVGGISAPIRSASGFHIVRLTEKRGDTEKVVQQTAVQHILIKPTEIRSDTTAKLLMDDLYQQLKKGADFSVLAKTYSEDPGSARNGGDLGWVSPDQMVPEFEQVMNATAVGHISAPFRSHFGWHILKISDRRQQDMSETFRSNQAKNLIFKRKYEDELDAWLKEIRRATFVEIKLPTQENTSAPTP